MVRVCGVMPRWMIMLATKWDTRGDQYSSRDFFFLPETAFLKRKLAKIVLPVVFFYRPLHSSVQVPHAPSQKYDGCLCGQGGNVPLLDVRPHQYTQASVLYSLIWRPICFAETALKHLKVIHFHFNTKILNRVLSRCCH